MLIFGAHDEVGPAALVHHVLDPEADIPAVTMLRPGGVEGEAGSVAQPSLDIGDRPAAVTVEQPVAPGPAEPATGGQKAGDPNLAGGGQAVRSNAPRSIGPSFAGQGSPGGRECGRGAGHVAWDTP